MSNPQTLLRELALDDDYRHWIGFAEGRAMDALVLLLESGPITWSRWYETAHERIVTELGLDMYNHPDDNQRLVEWGMHHTLSCLLQDHAVRSEPLSTLLPDATPDLHITASETVPMPLLIVNEQRFTKATHSIHGVSLFAVEDGQCAKCNKWQPRYHLKQQGHFGRCEKEVCLACAKLVVSDWVAAALDELASGEQTG